VRTSRLLSIVCLGSIVLGCGSEQSESLELSDRIVSAAIALKGTGDSHANVAHTLNIGDPSLVAIIPASGVDRSQLPSGVTEVQVAGLLEAAQMWNGKIVVAVIWAGGSSSGASIEQHVAVPRQLAVLKPARGAVTVRLVRDSAGGVSIAELR
jgi:hypothetical protein